MNARPVGDLSVRTSILIVSAAAATVLTSLPAYAQSAPNAGLRVGILGGLDIVRPGSTEDSDVDGDDQSTEGVLYGVDVGFDIPLGGLVLGIEGEWSDSTGKIKANRSDPNFFGYGTVASGRDLYAGGRLGFVMAPGTMIYAKGGYTNARLNVIAGSSTTQTDDTFRLDGWRVGAGAEQALSANTYAKLEYRYSNYNDAELAFREGGTSNAFKVDTDRHQVVAGLGIRF
ncbi:porin family protein [Sphingomonas sp. S-NIH.Pt15_0812]|nr:porin family protein [Sphingomonas sp. S-NIH.Pt15_0812]